MLCLRQQIGDFVVNCQQHKVRYCVDSWQLQSKANTRVHTVGILVILDNHQLVYSSQCSLTVFRDVFHYCKYSLMA